MFVAALRLVNRVSVQKNEPRSGGTVRHPGNHPVSTAQKVVRTCERIRVEDIETVAESETRRHETAASRSERVIAVGAQDLRESPHLGFHPKPRFLDRRADFLGNEQTCSRGIE